MGYFIMTLALSTFGFILGFYFGRWAEVESEKTKLKAEINAIKNYDK